MRLPGSKDGGETMGLIFIMSLRNLFRQKRRNLLLGIGIGFGMMILVVSNAFSHGMIDFLVNDTISGAFGHIVIQGSSDGRTYHPVIRDRGRIEKIVRETIDKDHILTIQEILTIYGRATGNQKADNLTVAGADLKSEKEWRDFLGNLSIKAGDYREFFSEDIEYPVIISSQKAKSLNVQVHDIIRFRIQMVTGQIQVAQFTVVAIADSNNLFANMVVFMDAKRLRKLMGYKPWESANLKIALKNPKQNAIHYAGILREKLKPKQLTITGRVDGVQCLLLAFKNDDAAKSTLNRNIQILQGDPSQAFARDGVVVSNNLAEKLHLQPGSEFSLEYPTKFQGMNQLKLKATAVAKSGNILAEDMILANGDLVYDLYNRFLPHNKNPPAIDTTLPINPALATEWKVLPRSRTSQELQKTIRKERKIKNRQARLNVVTMYEGVSEIMTLETAINSITLNAVLVLLFIILIGVVNTLRMSIKERTREIGTIRAIGMQKKDVRNLFLMETLLLTAFSCGAGILLGIGVMRLLESIPISDSAFRMLLKNNHLYFKMSFESILFNFLLIMLISGITAYFPARRAANMTAVEALRHYE